MQTIWKYTLEITDRQVISMPAGAQVLSVANQQGNLCLWALVDPDETGRHGRVFEIHGTGNPIPTAVYERRFVGAAVIDPFVWHVFERVN